MTQEPTEENEKKTQTSSDSTPPNPQKKGSDGTEEENKPDRSIEELMEDQRKAREDQVDFFQNFSSGLGPVNFETREFVLCKEPEQKFLFVPSIPTSTKKKFKQDCGSIMEAMNEGVSGVNKHVFEVDDDELTDFYDYLIEWTLDVKGIDSIDWDNDSKEDKREFFDNLSFTRIILYLGTITYKAF